MDALNMMQTAAALFALAAVGGLTMAAMRLRGTPTPPPWLAMGHGVMAAAGLTLMVYAAIAIGIAPLAQVATGLFVVAAIGGVAMNLGFHWRRQPLPIALMLGHALLAVLGFALLLWSLLAVRHGG